MKKTLSAILILFALQTAFAQAKPLSQTEYVRMLYALKTAASSEQLAETVRKRGIAFELTDGLRGLTRSKSANNEDLKRALEEADRRRQNPATAKLPSEREATEILEKTRKNTLAAVEEMPDFVVKQQIQRSAAYAGTNNFRNLDSLVVAVGVSAEKKNEYYKVLLINGAKVDENQRETSVGGFTSRGEFSSFLKKVFETATNTEFNVLETDLLRGRNTIIYDFDVPFNDKTSVGLGLGTSYGNISAAAGLQGRVWIDTKDFRVLRLQYKTKDVPIDFPLREVKARIDYDWVMISAEKVLLPVYSEVKLLEKSGSNFFESLNRIRFKDYQKFGTDVIVLDEDAEPIKEEKP